MSSFTTLTAWQIGMELMKESYRLTEQYPKAELFGLTSQIRRASTSILANLAEGFSRRTHADKAHKYTIARGECSEVYALMLMSIELQYISQEQAQRAIALTQRTGKLISGLIRTYS